MITAAAIAAVSIAAILLFDFALGSGAQRVGPSMISAAAIERAGASVVVTGALGTRKPETKTMGQIYQPQEADNIPR
jgi:hypothetical protein